MKVLATNKSHVFRDSEDFNGRRVVTDVPQVPRPVHGVPADI